MWLIAGGWAGLAAMSLLLGGVAVRLFKPSVRFVAVVMALGSGVLIASVAYDLVQEASPETPIHWLLLALIAGALVFVLGSRAIGRMGGRRRKAPQGSDDSSGLAIALGSVLDGLPESLVLGLTVLAGGVSPQLFAGIVLSNFPEGMASSSGLMRSGWRFGSVMKMWGSVVIASAIAGALGPLVLASAPPIASGVAQSFAAGALLTMIVDTMIPESYAVERNWTGLLVVIGFAGTLLVGSL
jgi:ZIP family zinc transporter